VKALLVQEQEKTALCTICRRRKCP